MNDSDLAVFCSMPENITQNGVCMWPDGHITWTAMESMPGMPDDVYLQNLKLGFAWWEPYCGVTMSYVESAANARIRVYARRIDGAGKILAQCELPCGNQSAVNMTIDTGEQWISELTPTQRGILLRLVVAHEAGHGIGLGHAPSGSSNLMAPIYSPSVLGAGAFDLSESQKRYGGAVPKPPTPVPTPTPTPTPGVKKKLIIEYDGQLVNPQIVASEVSPVVPTIPVTPVGGDSMSNLLKWLKAAIDLAGPLAALTPNTTDDKIVALIKQILDAGILGQVTDEHIAAIKQTLDLKS